MEIQEFKESMKQICEDYNVRAIFAEEPWIQFHTEDNEIIVIHLGYYFKKHVQQIIEYKDDKNDN